MRTKHSYYSIFYRTIGLVFLFFIFYNTSKAQAYKNNWYFGNNIGLNFSSGVPQPVVAGSMIQGFNHSVTMSDDNGNLLFYSDAQTIWNANNNVVTGLVGGFLSGSNNTAQGVSFKNPANSSQYYYFYLTNTFFEGKVERNNSLYFSIIETVNTPNLTLIQEDVEVLCNNCTGQPFSEGITAIPHCNGIDYWVIVHGDKELVVYLVNSIGVNEFGVFDFNLPGERGNLKASPDGTRLALGIDHPTGGVRVYNFNSTTGQINNEIIITTNSQISGISFSPNSQILYASNRAVQVVESYNLSSPVPFDQMIINGANAYNMQLANDGRIYVNRGGAIFSQNFMGIIGAPDNFLTPNYIDQGFDLSPGASTHAITHFIDAIPPPIPTDFMAIVQECGKVIVDISPCFSGYNVNWNFGDGVGTSTNASTSYVYSNAGTFTISLTVSLGSVSQTFTQEVTVNTCCTAPTTIPTTGANSSAYGSSFGLFPGSIAINGNFTVNNNFLITNKTLLMAPNTKIIVLPGAKLTINKSSLYSCGTDMWDGIEIRPGGELIVSKTLVEDAKVAVLSENLGTVSKFNITNTTFNRNHTAIKVQQHQTGTQHPGIITGCTFDSRPSVTSTTNTRLLDAPFQNQTAETGIELSSVNSFVVGSASSPTAKNIFKYLKKGIHGLNSDYKVYNNEFSDNAPKGWAIYNYKGVKTVVGGSAANQPNLFKNLYNGISHRSSSDLLVEFNSFENINLPNIFLGNNATTVYTHECNKANITLYRNDVKSVTNGFVHFKNADARYTVKENTFNIFNGKAIAGIENSKGIIDVLNNTVTGIQSPIYSGNTAIYVVGTGITFSSTTVLKIYYNTISKANKGIHVINIGRPEIKQNTITFAANIFPSLSEFYFGIRSQNCAREEIHNNTIDKTGANPSAAIINALYGISLETSSNPAVSKNTVKKMGNGFRFRGFYDEADFRCNTMTNNWFGLTIDNAKIGDQGEAPSAAHPNGLAGDNTWTDPSIIGSPTAVKGYGTSYAPAFYTRSVGYGFTPESFHQTPLNVIITGSNSGLGFLNNAPQLCQTICYDPATCKIPKLAKIARNENPFDQVLGNQRFLMHEKVLKAVWSDSMIIDVNTPDGQDLQLFLDTIAFSNVGLTLEVNRLLAAEDTLAAEQLNLSINPKECADAFHKTVNEIYFRTWAKNMFEFTPTDSSTLTNIALQDPLVCGTAIYSARVMMNIDVNDYSVDNTNNNRLINVSKTEAVTILPTIKGKWYPNPAKDEVYYEIQLSDEQSGQLVVVDLMGKEHASASLINGNNKITFDVKMLPNGIYFYRVMVNNKIQEVNKFIIQH
ncbi:MAG: T9SS type A sorting domain-containing protein [Flavobacteriales bacterium]|nr:T9SS type A sorting domain-containing protein [Flavobacteriales bacterium]